MMLPPLASLGIMDQIFLARALYTLFIVSRGWEVSMTRILIKSQNEYKIIDKIGHVHSWTMQG